MKDSDKILQEVKKAVVGKDEVLEKVLMAMLAKGHILMEDIPGVGKTTMAKAFAQALQVNCSRMQFTVDVLPADVTGYNVLDIQSGKTHLKKGPIFTNIFLADEINRTSSRTQAALLEVMEETSVTIDGETMMLEDPFIVVATQNPVGSAGTQLLPDSQMDRFMIRLEIGYPSKDAEIEILKRKQQKNSAVMESVLDRDAFIRMQDECGKVYVHERIYNYIVSLIQATRNRKQIVQGASPRAAVALMEMAKACAYLRGRDYVIPEDVQEVFLDTVAHRMIMFPNNTIDVEQANVVLTQILQEIQPPQDKGTKL